jgi:hypothetical protein
MSMASSVGRLSLPHPWARAGVIAAAVVAAAMVGAMVDTRPKYAVAGVAVFVVVAWVWAKPQVAAYLVVGATPLVVGIDRGTIIPFFRPNEALAILLIGTLTARALLNLKPGSRLRITLHPLERALVMMALATSLVPIVLMLLRGRHVSGDDISYAIVMWKFLAIYGLVRYTVRTQEQVRWCLLLSVGAAAIVAMIAIFQALGLFGVRQMLSTYYVPFGYAGALALPRGGSTLALPAATADLLIFNFSLVIGIWLRSRRHALVLALAGTLFAFGTVAAAEFSSVIGLIVSIICLAVMLRRLDLLRYLPFGFVAAIAVMWPVVSHRLAGFQTLSGLPVSWVGRLHNLHTYFWPELMKGSNLLLGVRPSSRVTVHSQGTGYVWIESGYTWLLWGGGVPLFAAFCYFVWISVRTGLASARPLSSWSAVAGLAAATGVVVVAVLMLFDPHLTYRGSADCLFALMALMLVEKAPLGGTADIADKTADTSPLASPSLGYESGELISVSQQIAHDG